MDINFFEFILYYVVFCINLQHIKILNSFTLTNFKHSVLISRENILQPNKLFYLRASHYKINWFVGRKLCRCSAGNLSFERQISSNRHRKSAIIAQKNGGHLTLREHHHCFFTHLKLFMGFRYGTEGRYYHLHFKSGNSPEMVVPNIWQYANRITETWLRFLQKNLIMY
jgi:hypothetical protein